MPPDLRLLALVPEGTPVNEIPKNVEWIMVEDPQREFLMLINRFSRWVPPGPDLISPTAEVHPTVVITDGMRVVKGLSLNEKVAHFGIIRVEDYSTVGAYTVLHRALLGETVIGKNCHVGSLCTIGHNCRIGDQAIMTARVSIAGSSHVGDRCWFGVGSVVSNQVSICPDVLIGAGSVVTRDITEPGVYAGVPAQYLKDWNGEW